MSETNNFISDWIYTWDEIENVRKNAEKLVKTDLSELRNFIRKDVRNKNLEVISNYKDAFTKLLDLLKKYPNIDVNLVNSLNISNKRDCMKIIQIALWMTWRDVDWIFWKDTFKAILEFQLNDENYKNYKCDKKEEEKCPLVTWQADAIIGLGMIFSLCKRLEEWKLEILPESESLPIVEKQDKKSWESKVDEKKQKESLDKKEQKEVLEEGNLILKLLKKWEITPEDIKELLKDEDKLKGDLLNVFNTHNHKYIEELEKIFFFDYRWIFEEDGEENPINIILKSLKNLDEWLKNVKNIFLNEEYKIIPIDIKKDKNTIDNFFKFNYKDFSVEIYMDWKFALSNDKLEFLQHSWKFSKQYIDFDNLDFIRDYLVLKQDEIKKIFNRENMYKYDISLLLLPINRSVLETTLRNIYKDDILKNKILTNLWILEIWKWEIWGLWDSFRYHINNFLTFENDFVKQVIEKLEEKSKEEEKKTKK